MSSEDRRESLSVSRPVLLCSQVMGGALVIPVEDDCMMIQAK